jgi:hypothetical protein
MALQGRRGSALNARVLVVLLGTTAAGICLLLGFPGSAAAQVSGPVVSESPLENPFGDRTAGPYLIGEPPGVPAPGLPAMMVEPGLPPVTAPATLGDLLFADGRQTPSDYRAGAFQKLAMVNTYLPRMGSDGFGTYDFELTSVWGLPCPTKDAPMVITPGIATHWLDGPANLDIPAQLHDVYTEFRWLPKFGERFRADLAVQPGFYSDWDGSSVRAVRILGHGSGIYDWTPTFQLVLGVAYLDRPDIELLPIAGFIWKPDPDAEYRVVFPTPKVAWRVGSGTVTTYTDSRIRDFETWFYVAGELGGGTWAIRHSDGTSDLMSYSDWRIYLGIENRTIHQIPGLQVEVGYVFHRRIRLSTIGEDVDVGDTVMVRAALNY